MNIIVSIIFCILYAILNVIGTSFIKNELTIDRPNTVIEYIYFVFRVKVILGLILNFLSVFATLKALSLARFSYVVPIALGINFILTIIAGHFFFKDKFSILSFCGIVLILFGIIVMSYDQ